MIITDLLEQLTPEQIRNSGSLIYNCAKILNDINNATIKLAIMKASLNPGRRTVMEIGVIEKQIEMLWLDYEDMSKLIR